MFEKQNWKTFIIIAVFFLFLVTLNFQIVKWHNKFFLLTVDLSFFFLGFNLFFLHKTRIQWIRENSSNHVFLQFSIIWGTMGQYSTAPMKVFIYQYGHNGIMKNRIIIIFSSDSLFENKCSCKIESYKYRYVRATDALLLIKLLPDKCQVSHNV